MPVVFILERLSEGDEVSGISLRDIQAQVALTAENKGWNIESPHLPTAIALMHSELSEALESWRNDEPAVHHLEGKPEGWAIELADCVIRILHFLSREEIDLTTLILFKDHYNQEREFRHGGKKI